MRLQIQLGLAEVVHCPTRSQDASPRAFTREIHDPGLLLAVCLRGVSRTHHGRHAHRLCRALGVPFVDCARMPHPQQLVAELAKLQLAEALRRRGKQVKAGHDLLGGAA
jgi:hypothetical protein